MECNNSSKTNRNKTAKADYELLSVPNSAFQMFPFHVSLFQWKFFFAGDALLILDRGNRAWLMQ